jgi:DNA-binding Xre family transcriptional regulator
MTRLQKILNDKSWSVRDLQRAIEDTGESVPYYALTQMANGKRTNYNVLTLKKLCAALSVTPNDLVEDEVQVFNHSECDRDYGF